MRDLKEQRCVPCEGGTKPLDAGEVQKYITLVKTWRVVDNKKIEKSFTFVDFKHAVGFINKIADVAEFEGHHPDINLHNWNKITITLSTHAIKGLSQNDFILAAKIDQIIRDAEAK